MILRWEAVAVECHCPGVNCPVEETLRMIGGKYKALILWQLLSRTLRFSELHRLIPQATPKMLTQQLRELEADGLLTRAVFAEVPPRVEYTLTEKGRSIRSVLYGMFDWGAEALRGSGKNVNCSMVSNRT